MTRTNPFQAWVSASAVARADRLTGSRIVSSHYWMRIVLLLLMTLSALGSSRQAFAQGSKVTPQAVSAAIARCVDYLKSNQGSGNKPGKWSGHDADGCGQTCLVTIALLSAGRDAKSPEVTKALNYIRGVKPYRTYELSLKIMVLCLAEPKKDMPQIEQLVKLLVKRQLKDSGNNSGGWPYLENSGGDADESNTQFAVLALWEASKLGIEIDSKCFEQGNIYWTQRNSGGAWGYRGSPPTGSMTCAGIASMIILQDAFEGVDAAVDGEQIQCCGLQNDNGTNLDRPINWLARNFAVTHNPGSGAYTYYYLYALERVGRLTGQRFIGQHDWYREGAEFLLSSQDIGGSFRGGGEDTITASAMALLFLSKGKRQVVIGHLQHGEPASNDWNLHRRSVQNLTGQIEKVWKRELAWQSVRLERANLADLLETPILFISGSKEWKLTDDQRKMLKDYTDQGGFIFAEACNGDGCNGAAFEQSFRNEMEKIFDKPLQKLAPSHPIWSAEAKVNPSALPKDFWLYGLDSCCRTSVVLSPISLSCRWELAKPFGAVSKRAASVEADITNAVKIGVNIAAYATGRELKDKLDAVQVIQARPDPQSLVRGSLTVPKIMHGGGADDTPKAVVNLLEVFRRESQSIVAGKTPMVSLTSEDLEKYPILYIHGRNRFAFTDADRQGLKNHIENGGFVIGDAICASSEFTESVKREFALALPESSWRKIDPKHPVMQRNGPVGFDLGNVGLIDPSSGADLKQSTREGPAELDSLEWNGRVIMLFSPNDLSCAMESKHSLQCRGYVRDDAFRIGINMLLYALMQ